MHHLRTRSDAGPIEQLRAEVHGQVTGPDDLDYDAARAVFLAGVDRRPAAIVRVADAADVARVLSVARATGLPLAVRGGGHSLAAHGVVDGGIVLDLAGLRRLEIDAVERTAWAETGLTAGEYTRATAEHGLATGFGDSGAVGIGGITLAGGVGFLHRAHGLTIDNVLAAEVVTANGEFLRVDDASHPELFFALRGGGGNFGVVTRFRYRLREVGAVTAGFLILPATARRIAAIVAAAQEASDALSGLIVVTYAPPMPTIPVEHHGRPILMIHLVHSGALEEGERVFARLRTIAPPLVDQVEATPYPKLYEAGGPPPPTHMAVRSTFLDQVDATLAELILAELHASSAPIRMAQFRVLGGAVARVPRDATAFAHRDRGILASSAAMYVDAADTPTHQAWVDDLAIAMRQGEPGAYTGFLSTSSEALTREAYPDKTGERLAAIKAIHDPENLFRYNVNVTPQIPLTPKSPCL